MKYRFTLLLIVILWSLSTTIYGQTNRDNVAAAINNAYFSVPESPAFALLPNKPSEITDLATPHDFLAQLPVFIDGDNLRTGVALDFRPFALAPKNLSLEKYQQKKNWLKRGLWRTSVSLGSIPIPESSDLNVSLGIRIPIIDKADPRNNKKLQKDLQDTYLDWLEEQGPLPFDATSSDAQARLDAKKPALKEIREAFVKNHWNATRLTLGLASMWRAENSSFKRDSIEGDKVGGWIAYSAPFFKMKSHQFATSVKHVWNNNVEDDELNREWTIGVRHRWFICGIAALSAEASWRGNTFKNNDAMRDRWLQYGVILEVPCDLLKGVFGISYGGTVDRDNGDDPPFGVSYAVYTDRLIKK